MTHTQLNLSFTKNKLNTAGLLMGPIVNIIMATIVNTAQVLIVHQS